MLGWASQDPHLNSEQLLNTKHLVIRGSALPWMNWLVLFREHIFNSKQNHADLLSITFLNLWLKTRVDWNETNLKGSCVACYSVGGVVKSKRRSQNTACRYERVLFAGSLWLCGGLVGVTWCALKRAPSSLNGLIQVGLLSITPTSLARSPFCVTVCLTSVCCRQKTGSAFVQINPVNRFYTFSHDMYTNRDNVIRARLTWYSD